MPAIRQRGAAATAPQGLAGLPGRNQTCGPSIRWHRADKPCVSRLNTFADFRPCGPIQVPGLSTRFAAQMANTLTSLKHGTFSTYHRLTQTGLEPSRSTFVGLTWYPSLALRESLTRAPLVSVIQVARLMASTLTLARMPSPERAVATVLLKDAPRMSAATTSGFCAGHKIAETWYRPP